MATDQSALPSVTDILAQWEGIVGSEDNKVNVKENHHHQIHQPEIDTQGTVNHEETVPKSSDSQVSQEQPKTPPKPPKPKPMAPPKPSHLSSFKVKKEDHNEHREDKPPHVQEQPSTDPVLEDVLVTDPEDPLSPHPKRPGTLVTPNIQERSSYFGSSPVNMNHKNVNQVDMPPPSLISNSYHLHSHHPSSASLSAPIPPPSRSLTPKSQISSPKLVPDTPPLPPPRDSYSQYAPEPAANPKNLSLSPRRSDGNIPPPVPPPRSPSMITTTSSYKSIAPLSQQPASIARFLSDGNYDPIRHVTTTSLIAEQQPQFSETYMSRPRESGSQDSSTSISRNTSASGMAFGPVLPVPGATISSPAPSLPPRPSETNLASLSNSVPQLNSTTHHQNYSSPNLASSVHTDNSSSTNTTNTTNTNIMTMDSLSLDDNGVVEEEPANLDSGYPDMSRVNRRPPSYEGPLNDIHIKGDVKASAVLENYVALAGLSGLMLYNLQDGSKVLADSLHETKVTALSFIPTLSGVIHLWIGTKDGQLWEMSTQSGEIVAKQMKAHFGAIVAMEPNCGNVWTLSEDGKICIWANGDMTTPPKPFRVSPNFKAFCVSGSTLWIGRNKQVFVYEPSLTGTSSFALTPRPINASLQKPTAASAPSEGGARPRGIGEFTSAACVATLPDLVFFGHDDGTVTVFSKSHLAVKENITVSIHKICSMVGLRKHLWIGFNTGQIIVCDVSQKPWKVLKEWKAHDTPVLTLVSNKDSSMSDSLPVISCGHASTNLRVWDGFLKLDAIEADVMAHDADYSTFSDVTVKIVTWNTGSAKPGQFKGRIGEQEFVHRALLNKTGMREYDEPDIIVFGFQELIELDNRKLTAKTVLLKGKKDVEKKVSTSSHISHQYKAWQDCLSSALSQGYSTSYQLVQSSNMVGLFTCVFMKEEVSRYRLRGTRSSAIKTGLGGYHGNKGALAVRVLIDDSSICFLNCHLAAGQTGLSNRNKDIETILEARFLDETQNTKYLGKGIFVNGGDGTMIMDHEVVFMSGDMNYRINLLRQLATRLIEEGDYGKLLEQDQLSSQLKKNPGLRLRPFQEPPIEFAPTYKFDVGTDRYDTSEKKRVPAWCDRIFYRGKQRVTPLEYTSLMDVQASDHKPVIGYFKVQVKTIDANKREEVYRQSLARWDASVLEWMRSH